MLRMAFVALNLTLLASVVGLSAPPAQAQAAAGDLKLGPAKKVDPKLSERRATDALLGYYRALIRGDYDQAGSFAHPDAIEPVRKKLLDLIRTAPPAQRNATLKNLGATEVSALQSQTTAQFFASYARSSYASSIQALASPKRKARVTVKKVRCDPTKPRCDVTFDLHQTLDDGREVVGTNNVRVANVDGRWLVGEGIGG